MNPLRKQFTTEKQFPFDLVYKARKSPQDELPDHLHDWYELVYVYQGTGIFFIDQNFYDMNAGDLFLIPGNTIHRAFPESTDPVTSSALFFVPIMLQHFDLGDAYANLRCFEHAKKLKSFKLEILEQERFKIEKLLEDINDEQKQQLPGYRQAILLHLQRLLLLLNRLIIPEASRNKRESTLEPRWLQKILTYIDLHLDGELSLSPLSQYVSISPAHFSRVFKQLTGMNLTDYVTAKRIVLAKELLLQTDDNISYIAEKCGFESLPHFYRMFKKTTGITPAKYKQIQRSS